MSCIEEKVAAALSDLEGLLAEGLSPEKALSIAAADNGIRSDVLEIRAKPLGDLEVLAKKLSVPARMHAAVHRYMSEEPFKIGSRPFAGWYAAEVGPLTTEEAAFGERHVNDRIKRKQAENTRVISGLVRRDAGIVDEDDA